MRWCTVVGLSIVVMGCEPSLRSRAEVAYGRGDFLGAVTLYDQVLAREPDDGGAHVARARARNAAFGSILGAAHAARVSGKSDVALTHLRRVLDLRRDWKIAAPPQIAPALAIEVTAATTHIDDTIARALHTGPFAANAALAPHAALLRHPDFGTRPAELASMIRTAGRAACAKLVPTASPGEPYWTWLVDRACAHWGAQRLVVPVLPHQLPALEVTGSVDGALAAQNLHLRESVGAAFRASVWYAPSATGHVQAAVAGKIAARLSAQPISLTATWTESVPYTAYEPGQESYQEPYDETESYQEQVPYTEYQTKTVPCGATSCTSTEPVTVYRSESKTRTVTKHRTAWRSVTVPVTRYRDESRSFDYQATQRDGHYTSEVRAQFDGVLGDLAPSITSDFTETGIDHDVTHSEAAVSPQRSNLMTLGSFVEREQQRMRDRVLDTLGGHYRKLHCTAATYTLDTAAACAFLDPKSVPPSVHAALRATLGADEPHLMRALGR